MAHLRARTTRGKATVAEPAIWPGEQESALADGEKNLKILLRVRGSVQNGVDIMAGIHEFATGSTLPGIEVTFYDQQKIFWNIH